MGLAEGRFEGKSQLGVDELLTKDRRRRIGGDVEEWMGDFAHRTRRVSVERTQAESTGRADYVLAWSDGPILWIHLSAYEANGHQMLPGSKLGPYIVRLFIHNVCLFSNYSIPTLFLNL